MYDAIVIGGGLAGSYVSRELAARGHSVIVLEQKGSLGEAVCCTGIVGKECLDTFPVSENIILRRANSASFFAPTGRGLRVQKKTTQAYILDRPAFDVELAREAQERGAEYLLNSRVCDIEVANGGIRVEADCPDKEYFEGKVAVIASGFGSKLPQRLGFGTSGDCSPGADRRTVVRRKRSVVHAPQWAAGLRFG